MDIRALVMAVMVWYIVSCNLYSAREMGIHSSRDAIAGSVGEGVGDRFWGRTFRNSAWGSCPWGFGKWGRDSKGDAGRLSRGRRAYNSLP